MLWCGLFLGWVLSVVLAYVFGHNTAIYYATAKLRAFKRQGRKNEFDEADIRSLALWED